MRDPDVPAFTRRDRDRARLLHFADVGDQTIRTHLIGQNGFVAHHDGLNVAVFTGQIEGGADLALVAVDGGSDRFALAVAALVKSLRLFDARSRAVIAVQRSVWLLSVPEIVPQIAEPPAPPVSSVQTFVAVHA